MSLELLRMSTVHYTHTMKIVRTDLHNRNRIYAASRHKNINKNKQGFLDSVNSSNQYHQKNLAKKLDNQATTKLKKGG